MGIDGTISQKDEYVSLRQELLESKRYVFERPLLIAAAGIAALSAFRGIQVAAAVPLVIAGLLLFNLWFTVNRLYSAGRIVAYIQVQLEEQRLGPWMGWETCLREYRKWIKRPDAKVVVDRELDSEAVPDALFYYPAIHRLHVGIAAMALLSCGLIVLEDSSVIAIASAAGTIVLTAWFAVHAVRYRPTKVRAIIERNRIIWKYVLQELAGHQTAGADG